MDTHEITKNAGHWLTAVRPAGALLVFLLTAGLQAQEFALDLTSFAATTESSGGDFSLKSSIGLAEAGPESLAGEFILQPGFWSAAGVLPPTLGLVRDGLNVVLFWPESAGGGFVLEKADFLANPSANTIWTAAGGSVQLSGGFYRVTVPIASGNRFFRLHQP